MKRGDAFVCCLLTSLIAIVVSLAVFFGYTILAPLTGADLQFVADPRTGVTMRTLFPSVAQIIDLDGEPISSHVHANAHNCPWLVTFYSDGCGHCRSAAPKLSTMARQFARIGNVTDTQEEREQDGLLESAMSDDDSVRALMGTSVVLQGAVNCVQFGSACGKEGVMGVPTLNLYLPATRPTLQGADTRKVKTWGRRDTVHLSSAETTVLGVGRAWVDYRRAVLKDWSEDDSHFCRSVYRSLVQKKREMIARRQGDAIDTAAPSEFLEIQTFAPTDVANAFFYTMYHEVALKGVPNADSRKALMNFLWRVFEQLPGLSASRLIAFLAKDLPFNATEWQQAVLDAEVPILGTPQALQWRTCRGSSWQYRGFPCGMWLLYHSLTVAESHALSSVSTTTTTITTAAAAAAASSGVDAKDTLTRPTLSTAVKGQAVPSSTVLHEILDYARHFFTCEPCRQHFMRFTPDPTEDPALQLWRVHNRVNYFLGRPDQGPGESGASDPLVPKRQFPPVPMCPNCYRSRVNNSGVTATDGPLSDDAFDLNEVLKFLRLRYQWNRSPSGASSSTPPPYRGAEGNTSARPRATEDVGLSAIMTMLMVLVLIGGGMGYSLTRRRTRTRAHAVRHQLKSIV